MTTVAETLTELLVAAGIECGFGVPGGQTLPFYAAARRRGFRHVLMRDERNAACAADAFARVSGRVGFCDATLGPGATNLVSGLAEAYASSVPVLALVADVKTSREHLRERGVASQALDQRAFLQSVAKWYARVHTPAALRETFRHALRVATTGRCGPVILEIPEDVIAAKSEDGSPSAGVSPQDSVWPRYRSAPEPRDLRAIVSVLRGARHPVLLAGGGAVASGASDVITQLADRHGIAVVTSLNGKGAIAETHPCALGPVGVFGSTRASRALQRADVVLAVGTKFAQFNSFLFRLPDPHQSVLQIDIDATEIGRAIPVVGAAVADARTALEALAAELGREEIKFVHPPYDDAPRQPGADPDDGAVAPEDIMAVLDQRGRAQDVFVTDASLASGWAAPRYRVKSAGRGFLAPRGLAGIGWAGGAAIGAALAAAHTGGRVIALAGDGAAGYWLGELETAARLKLSITFVILNNSGYGWVVQGERTLGISPESTFGPVDYSAVARGLGAEASRVCKGDDLEAALAAALEAKGPALVDVVSSQYGQPSVDWGELDPSARNRYGAYGMG
jgi:acetolactate synthase-1/2/3 large subunit